MIKFLMKKYALSRQGAKDLIIATISCMVHNLTLMLPVSLLYLLVSDLYAGGVPQGHLWIYIVGMVAAVLLILFSYRWVYERPIMQHIKKVLFGVFRSRKNCANCRCPSSESATFQTSLRPLWRIAPCSNSPFRTGYPNFSVR